MINDGTISDPIKTDRNTYQISGNRVDSDRNGTEFSFLFTFLETLWMCAKCRAQPVLRYSAENIVLLFKMYYCLQS